MKRILILLILATPAFTQERDHDKIMQSYIEMSKPVAAHQRLAAMSGKLDITTKLWFDPGQPPQVFRGTGEAKMILGGRFLEITANMGGKMPYQMLELMGFDTRTNDYTLVSYDTLGTYSVTAAGKYDEAQQAMVLLGSYLQPPANEVQHYRFVVKDGVHTIYFATPDGKEMRVAETTYARSTR